MAGAVLQRACDCETREAAGGGAWRVSGLGFARHQAPGILVWELSRMAFSYVAELISMRNIELGRIWASIPTLIRFPFIYLFRQLS